MPIVFFFFFLAFYKTLKINEMLEFLSFESIVQSSIKWREEIVETRSKGKVSIFKIVVDLTMKNNFFNISKDVRKRWHFQISWLAFVQPWYRKFNKMMKKNQQDLKERS